MKRSKPAHAHAPYGVTRKLIAQIVKDLPKGTHLTVPEVFERTKELGLPISISTVYRILNKMKLQGTVSTVAGDRSQRYETADSDHDHDHLICLGCGLTIEFMDELIRGFGKSVAERKGFEHRSSRFDILGYCKRCSSKDHGHRFQQSLDNLGSALNAAEESVLQLRQAFDLNSTFRFAKGSIYMNGAIAALRQALTDCENAQSFLAKEHVHKLENRSTSHRTNGEIALKRLTPPAY